jgi:hypothetical protein
MPSGLAADASSGLPPSRSHDAHRVAHWQGVQLASVPAMVLVGAARASRGAAAVAGANLTSSYANISPLKALGIKGSSSCPHTEPYFRACYHKRSDGSLLGSSGIVH